jgi:PAS domain-containing protein
MARRMPTERRQTANALKADEERLRQLVESAVDLIYYCSPEGRFTYVNPTACRVMKYTEQELIGRHFLTLIRPDFAERAKTLYSRQLADRTPNTYLSSPPSPRTATSSGSASTSNSSSRRAT